MFVIKWDAANVLIFLQGETVIPDLSEQSGFSDSNTKFVWSMLNVSNPEDDPLAAGGVYVCNVKNHNGQVNNASVEISISESCASTTVLLKKTTL